MTDRSINETLSEVFQEALDATFHRSGSVLQQRDIDNRSSPRKLKSERVELSRPKLMIRRTPEVITIDDDEVTDNLSQNITLPSPRKKLCRKETKEDLVPKNTAGVIDDEDADLLISTKLLQTPDKSARTLFPSSTPPQTPGRTVQPAVTPGSTSNKPTAPQTPGGSWVSRTSARDRSNSVSSPSQRTKSTLDYVEVFDEGDSNDDRIFKTPRKLYAHQSPHTPKVSTPAGQARTPRTPAPATPETLTAPSSSRSSSRSPYSFKNLTPLSVIRAESFKRINEEMNIVPFSDVEVSELRREVSELRRTLFGVDHPKERSCSNSPEKRQLGNNPHVGTDRDDVENIDSTQNSDRKYWEPKKDGTPDSFMEETTGTEESLGYKQTLGEKGVTSRNDDLESTMVCHKRGDTEETHCDISGIQDLDLEEEAVHFSLERRGTEGQDKTHCQSSEASDSSGHDQRNIKMSGNEKEDTSGTVWASTGLSYDENLNKSMFLPSKISGDIPPSPGDGEADSHNVPLADNIGCGSRAEGITSHQSVMPSLGSLARTEAARLRRNDATSPALNDKVSDNDESIVHAEYHIKQEPKSP